MAAAREIRSGVWRSKVLVGYKDGDTTRPIQHTETYGKDAAPVGKIKASKLHADHVARCAKGEVSTAVDTFGAYLSTWLNQRAKTWSATTERRNRSIVAKLPVQLTKIKLSQLKRGDIQVWVDSGIVPSASIKRHHAVIQSALKDAVTGEKVGLARNLALGIRLPVTKDPEPTPPEDDEVARILNVAGTRGEMWRDLFTFVANTGLRRGEVCGLQWGDLSEDLSEVHIRHAVEVLVKSRDGATWALKDTKTHQDRALPLSAAARRALQRRRGESRPDPQSFVFHNRGPFVPVHPDHVSTTFSEVADDAKCGHVRLKDFRSFASTVLTEAAGLAVAQQFLGHKDMSTTARHYTGARKSALAAGVAALDALDVEQPALT